MCWLLYDHGPHDYKVGGVRKVCHGRAEEYAGAYVQCEGQLLLWNE